MGCEFGIHKKVAPIDTSSNRTVNNSVNSGILRQNRTSINNPYNNVILKPPDGFLEHSSSILVKNIISLTTTEPDEYDNGKVKKNRKVTFEQRFSREPTSDSRVVNTNNEVANASILSSDHANNHNDSLEDDTISLSDPLTVEADVNHLLIATYDYVEMTDVIPEAFDISILQQRQDAIDNTSYRSIIQSWQPDSLEQLIKTIKTFRKGKSIIDQHWIVFYWITYNINYDVVAFLADTVAEQSVEDTFRTKIGVCGDFSGLYKYLCDKLDLECMDIRGHAKSFRYEMRGVDATPIVNHAWNVVKIKKYWYIIESTWGAGSINKQKQFVREVNPYYFLIRPHQIIYDHLPKDEKWQLLETPISMSEYLQLPRIFPTYFKLELELISPLYQEHMTLIKGKPYALILLRTPTDVDILARFEINDKLIDGGSRIVFDAEHQFYRCYFAPNSIGKHKISIFAKETISNAILYDAAIDFTLDIDKLPENPISYPQTWKDFHNFGLKLISPKNTHLIKVSNGMTYACILIRAPSDVELIGYLYNSDEQKIIGAQHVYYDQQKDLWNCKFAPNQNGLFKATVFGKKKTDTGNYNNVISFKIEATEIISPPLSYPYIWQIFHDLNLTIDTPQNCSTLTWPENASYVEILMQAPDDILLSCGIQYNNIKVENGSLAQFDHEKNLWQLLFSPEQIGQHELVIFAKRNTEENFQCAAKFYLNVTQIYQAMKFPTIYRQFQHTKCRIYEPLNGILKRDTTVSIHCFIPNADDVNLTVDSNWDKIEGYKNSVLKTQITVGSKDLIIQAKYEQESTFKVLLKYSVQ
ncbi:unnamed protein product [Adineta steineri]|uniref:Transglutaminase-like domain-containing protein n=1 Tax=Adineta steineri TaxID=433720 RepID=A0A819SG02_9BILA|nr:unnamed protein product [Adineta steineri]